MTLTPDMFRTGQFPPDWIVTQEKKITVKHEDDRNPEEAKQELLDEYRKAGMKAPAEIVFQKMEGLYWEFSCPVGDRKTNLWEILNLEQSKTWEMTDTIERSKRIELLNKARNVAGIGIVAERAYELLSQFLFEKADSRRVWILEQGKEKSAPAKIITLTAEPTRITITMDHEDTRTWTLTAEGKNMQGHTLWTIRDSQPQDLPDDWLDTLNNHALAVLGPR